MYKSILVQFTLFTALASTSPLLPIPTIPSLIKDRAAQAYNWTEGWTTEFPIHHSCNATEAAQLERALGETIKLAQHAKDHILRFGNKSDIYTKFFGIVPSAEVIGWYDRVVNADKSETLFRCDDPDRNCATQNGWAGHWRGSNATQETVICERSFLTRWPLEALCGHGYTVSGSAPNFYFATDLLHRVYHVPAISEGVVEHFAEDYAECLELAEENPAEAARNSDTLQYFAIEAYAFDVALPGTGCAGEQPTHVAPSSAASTVAASVTSEAAASQTSAPFTTSSAPASKTSSAATECHTHADGIVHCV